VTARVSSPIRLHAHDVRFTVRYDGDFGGGVTRVVTLAVAPH